MEEDIVRNNRYGNTNDYDYGIVQEYGLYKYDKPSFSVIEYSESGEIIYEDYSALDKYIDEIFIPRYLKKNKVPHVNLCELIILRLSEIELTHVFNYLNNKNIYVEGTNLTFAGIFSNYIHKVRHETKFKKVLTKEENNKLICDYYYTKDPKIREKLIVSNLFYAQYLAYRYSVYYKLDREELESFAYEGIINAIDKCDARKVTNFTAYMCEYIRGSMLNGIKEIYAMSLTEYNHSIIKEKVMLEKEHRKSIDEELAKQLKENIINNNDNISQKLLKCLDDLISIHFMKISLDEIDDILDENASSLESKKQEVVSSLLNKLSQKEKKILVLKYGLIDGKKRTLIECGEYFGVTKAAIWNLENRIIKKIRKYYLDSLKEELYEIENVGTRVLR